MKIELRSDPELLCVVRSAVHQLTSVIGFSEKECRQVTLAMDEALANIIRHAYQNERGQPIEILCHREEDGLERGGVRLEFHLIDQGRGTEPAKLSGRPLDEVRPGGLGTHYIRQCMDEVEYAREGQRNHLRLVKYLRHRTQ